MDTLKEKIKYYREKKNITKSELARLIEVSPSYITMLENGEKQNPSFEILLKISNVLDISINELAGLNNVLEGFDKTLNSISSQINVSKIGKFSENRIIKNKQLTNNDVIEFFNASVIDIISLSNKGNDLPYDLDDFSCDELKELGNFVYIAYKLKIIEILERHNGK